MTVKQKQEFRIRLQKRARRRAEKRIDNLEEDRHFKTVSYCCCYCCCCLINFVVVVGVVVSLTCPAKV